MRDADQEGATAVEYGLVAGLLGVGLVVVGPLLADAFVVFLDVVLSHIPGVQ